MPENKPKKVAFVHDFLLTFGGAERVFREMVALYPEAPIYTLLAEKKVTSTYFPGRIIHTSFLQKFPLWLRRRYRWLLPLYPVAAETLDLRDFDLVITSSSAWSKGIVTRLKTTHIAYLHSPMRFVWDSFHWYPELQKKTGLLRRIVLSYLRLWDREAAARPDVLLANSNYTALRVEKYYRKKAGVIYPPVRNFGMEEKDTKKNFFLLVSRLTLGKRVDLAIEAFNKLGFELRIVGSGPDKEALKKIARPNIRFSGRVSDEALAKLYGEARALIQPSVEDFGLTAVEALSVGTPVIAAGMGGAKEIITPGVTGEFFEGETPEALADGVRRFAARKEGYNSEAMKETVNRFSKEKFQEHFKKAIEEVFDTSQ